MERHFGWKHFPDNNRDKSPLFGSKVWIACLMCLVLFPIKFVMHSVRKVLLVSAILSNSCNSYMINLIFFAKYPQIKAGHKHFGNIQITLFIFHVVLYRGKIEKLLSEYLWTQLYVILCSLNQSGHFLLIASINSVFPTTNLLLTHWFCFLHYFTSSNLQIPLSYFGPQQKQHK